MTRRRFEHVLGDRSTHRKWSGVAFRSVVPRYARSGDIISGEGSALHGGRWNPVGLRAVYGCLAPETAMAEPLEWFRRAGVPLARAMPRVFVALTIQLAASFSPTGRSALAWAFRSGACARPAGKRIPRR